MDRSLLILFLGTLCFPRFSISSDLDDEDGSDGHAAKHTRKKQKADVETFSDVDAASMLMSLQNTKAGAMSSLVSEDDVLGWPQSGSSIVVNTLESDEDEGDEVASRRRSNENVVETTPDDFSGDLTQEASAEVAPRYTHRKYRPRAKTSKASSESSSRDEKSSSRGKQSRSRGNKSGSAGEKSPPQLTMPRVQDGESQLVVSIDVNFLGLGYGPTAGHVPTAEHSSTGGDRGNQDTGENQPRDPTVGDFSRLDLLEVVPRPIAATLLTSSFGTVENFLSKVRLASFESPKVGQISDESVVEAEDGIVDVDAADGNPASSSKSPQDMAFSGSKMVQSTLPDESMEVEEEAVPNECSTTGHKSYSEQDSGPEHDSAPNDEMVTLAKSSCEDGSPSSHDLFLFWVYTCRRWMESITNMSAFEQYFAESRVKKTTVNGLRSFLEDNRASTGPAVLAGNMVVFPKLFSLLALTQVGTQVDGDSQADGDTQGSRHVGQSDPDRDVSDDEKGEIVSGAGQEVNGAGQGVHGTSYRGIVGDFDCAETEVLTDAFPFVMLRDTSKSTKKSKSRKTSSETSTHSQFLETVSSGERQTASSTGERQSACSSGEFPFTFSSGLDSRTHVVEVVTIPWSVMKVFRMWMTPDLGLKSHIKQLSVARAAVLAIYNSPTEEVNQIELRGVTRQAQEQRMMEIFKVAPWGSWRFVRPDKSMVGIEKHVRNFEASAGKVVESLSDEAIVVSNEPGWVESESDRVQAESDRAMAQLVRAYAEIDRVKTEIDKVKAEVNRFTLVRAAIARLIYFFGFLEQYDYARRGPAVDESVDPSQVRQTVSLITPSPTPTPRYSDTRRRSVTPGSEATSWDAGTTLLLTSESPAIIKAPVGSRSVSEYLAGPSTSDEADPSTSDKTESIASVDGTPQLPASNTDDLSSSVNEWSSSGAVSSIVSRSVKAAPVGSLASPSNSVAFTNAYAGRKTKESSAGLYDVRRDGPVSKWFRLRLDAAMERLERARNEWTQRVRPKVGGSHNLGVFFNLGGNSTVGVNPKLGGKSVIGGGSFVAGSSHVPESGSSAGNVASNRGRMAVVESGRSSSSGSVVSASNGLRSPTRRPREGLSARSVTLSRSVPASRTVAEYMNLPVRPGEPSRVGPPSLVAVPHGHGLIPPAHQVSPAPKDLSATKDLSAPKALSNPNQTSSSSRQTSSTSRPTSSAHTMPPPRTLPQPRALPQPRTLPPPGTLPTPYILPLMYVNFNFLTLGLPEEAVLTNVLSALHGQHSILPHLFVTPLYLGETAMALSMLPKGAPQWAHMTPVLYLRIGQLMELVRVLSGRLAEWNAGRDEVTIGSEVARSRPEVAQPRHAVSPGTETSGHIVQSSSAHLSSLPAFMSFTGLLNHFSASGVHEILRVGDLLIQYKDLEVLFLTSPSDMTDVQFYTVAAHDFSVQVIRLPAGLLRSTLPTIPLWSTMALTSFSGQVEHAVQINPPSMPETLRNLCVNLDQMSVGRFAIWISGESELYSWYGMFLAQKLHQYRIYFHRSIQPKKCLSGSIAKLAELRELVELGRRKEFAEFSSRISAGVSQADAENFPVLLSNDYINLTLNGLKIARIVLIELIFGSTPVFLSSQIDEIDLAVNPPAK